MAEAAWQLVSDPGVDSVMQTLALEQPGQFRFRAPVDPAKPAAGEVLVRAKRVGICGTDLHAFEGKQPFFSYPRILGA